MPNTNRFHFSPVLLSPLSIIEPGNWGRIHQTSPLFPCTDMRILEMIVEAVRRAEFAEIRPSRLTSTFVWNQEEDAQKWAKLWPDWGRNPLYEVEIIEANAPRHLGDVMLIRCPKGCSWLDVENFARRYWRGEHYSDNEYLIETVVQSPLRIVRRVQ